MDEKQITSGALYDAHDINPTSDKARVISVHDDIVAYEHVSQLGAFWKVCSVIRFQTIKQKSI